MRSLFSLLALLACASCASSERAARGAAIEARLRAKYDMDALTAFVRKVVEAHPNFAGVALSTRIDGKWALEKVDPPSRLRSGDWVLYDQHAGDDEFTVYTITKERPYAWITIHAKRLAKDRFEFLELTRDDVVELHVRKEPNKALEPTRTSVTPPAYAGVAPAARVAHL